MNFQRQTDGESCGAVSVQNAIIALGGEAQLGTIRSLAKTNKTGTSEAGIIRSLKALGYKATAYRGYNDDSGWKWLCRYVTDRPIILSVDAHRHWLVVYGWHGELVTVIDSGSDLMHNHDMGLFFYNKSQLMERWRSAWGLVAVRVSEA